MPTVHKSILTVTVLHEAGDTLDGMSLADIAYQMDEGSMLGQWTRTSCEPVPADKLHDEQLALGNDGTFFEVDAEPVKYDEHSADCAIHVHSANECTCGKAEWDALCEQFMQPDIQHGDYFEVETRNGTEYVPADVVSMPFVVIHGGGTYFHPDETGAAEFAQVVAALRDYLECDMVERVEPKTGWLARMSAPGYMDCTDWSAHDSEQEARDYLIEQYGND